LPHATSNFFKFTSANSRVVPPNFLALALQFHVSTTTHKQTKMADDVVQTATEVPNPPPKKKSLFSKKVVAQVAEAEVGVEFFSRSQEIFPQRLAEEERRRQKKTLKLERKRSSASLEKKVPSSHEDKRRRISKDHDPYSSDEHPEASWTRRYVIIIFIRVTVTDLNAGNLHTLHLVVANHVRLLSRRTKPLQLHFRDATAEIYVKRRRKAPH
jgi:hypothetical protein